MKMGTTCCT